MTNVMIYGMCSIALLGLVARAYGDQRMINKRSNLLAGNFDYDYTKEEIFISNKHGEVIIPRAHFEQWLHDEGRLEWVDDHYDHFNDVHAQHLGSFSINQYWLLDDKEIRKDLHLYLKKYL